MADASGGDAERPASENHAEEEAEDFGGNEANSDDNESGGGSSDDGHGKRRKRDDEESDLDEEDYRLVAENMVRTTAHTPRNHRLRLVTRVRSSNWSE